MPRIIHQITAFDNWVPLVNALVLSNVIECRHISHIAKNWIFGLHFCHRQCGFIFNQFDAAGFNS